ncbi:MAG TPA: sigma-70 family RNA polymerase sigma factor [Pirellulales bacterium]|jgi:RNA polymerase sigma-70 factor (ECF subfamily)
MTNSDEARRVMWARLLEETRDSGELDRQLRRIVARWPQLLDAGDLRELALSRAWERRDQFRGTTAAEFLAWLRRLAWSIALDRWRAQKRRARLLQQFAGLTPHIRSRVEDRVETRDLIDWLLAGLTDRERKLLMLKYYANMSFAEIAQAFDTTPSAVSQLHYRAILKLRERTNERGR